jgi:HSP20 family molecular chaperone IbpA
MYYATTNQLDRLLNEAFSDWPLWTTSVTSKLSNYHFEKTDEGYTFELAVPGLTKKDLTVRIVEGKLEIKNTNEDSKWSPSFTKTFTLPKDTDPKNIGASVKDGVLCLTIGLKENSENIINII